MGQYKVYEIKQSIFKANEVADVFENDEVEIVRSHFRKSLTGHVRVKVAHAAGVQLDDLFNSGV